MFLPKKLIDLLEEWGKEAETRHKSAELRRRIEGGNKVFCISCRYYIRRERKCDHPDNYEIVEKYDWEHTWTETYLKDSPKFKNSSNDCSDYKEGVHA